MAKGKLKKILAAVAAVAVVATASIFAYNHFSSKEPVEPVNPGKQIVALASPQNVSFDKDSYILSWDDVDHASGYKISYNDSIIDVDADQTSEQIFVTSQDNSFKVKAVGDGVEYSDSGWSNVVTYTVDQNVEEQTTFEKVNLELAKIAKENNMELQRVVGISYVNTERFNGGKNLRFETLCKIDGVLKNIEFSLAFDRGFTETEMLESIESASDTWVYENEIVSYNSAQYMLDGNALTGNMLELKNQGYTLSVVDSIVREGKKIGKNLEYEIVGTYKAELGGDVKYFTSIMSVQITQVSTNEKTNYEESLLVPQRYNLKETSFVMHEGTMEYMNDLVNKGSSTKTATVSNTSVSYSLNQSLGAYVYDDGGRDSL